MRTSTNLAGRTSRWSARHRKTAVLGWLAFVVLAVVLGGMVGQAQLTGAEQNVGPPAQAQRILDAHGWQDPASEMVLVQRRAAAYVKQIGLGLAVAVFLDATVIRALLLPSVMQLRGDRNWYLPRWLGRLPNVQREPPPSFPTARPEADVPVLVARD